MVLARWNYGPNEFARSDFIGPLDTYDYHFISAAPRRISGWLFLITVFDPPTWAFLFASVVAVSIALISINRYSIMSPKETAYESKSSPQVNFIFSHICSF